MIGKLNIDWDWVRLHLAKSEKITPSRKSKAKSAILSSFEECIDRARLIARPGYAHCEKKIASLTKTGIKLEDGSLLSGNSFFSYLKGAESVCIFLVTIGNGLEEEATRLMDAGDHLNGYLFDRIGSFAVESLAQIFENGLRDTKRKIGQTVSMRLSPGYCDWPLEEQFTLAKVLDFSKAGVRLTSGCMMIPNKTISAMAGIGPEGVFEKRVSQCSICDKVKDCDYRRI